MIEAKELHYTIRERTLVDGVSLRAETGQMLALVGPNGAGKSTLLRMLTGELTPTSGEIYLGEKPLRAWSMRDRARARAVLPQQSELSFPFSAHDVVLFGRSPHLDGNETAEDRHIAREALRATDMLHGEHHLYPTLSGGERQRVHAARAMAQIWQPQPIRVLLLDEPTASLDLAHQHRVLARSKQMAREGCAVVCVLHDLNLAAQYADACVVLKQGKVVARGEPADIFSTALLADVFEVDAHVMRHPGIDCPLIVTLGPKNQRPSAT